MGGGFRYEVDMYVRVVAYEPTEVVYVTTCFAVSTRPKLKQKLLELWMFFEGAELLLKLQIPL